MAYDLFYDLRGGVQVNEALVDLEFITVPGFRTLSARLHLRVKFQQRFSNSKTRTDLRVVIFRTFVGSLTGPLTRRFLSLALLMRSVETVNRMSTGSLEKKWIAKYRHFSRFLTFPEVRVILILWILAGGRGAPVASYSLSPLAT